MRTIFAPTLPALGIIVTLLAATVASSQAPQSIGSRGLEGAWDIRVSSDSNSVPPFDEFITFAAGGGLTETNNAFLPSQASPGHGSWAFANHGKFDFTFYKLLSLGPQGEFTGRLRVRGVIEMQGRNAWRSTATVDFLDPAGNVTLSDTTSAQATRIPILPR